MLSGWYAYVCMYVSELVGGVESVWVSECESVCGNELVLAIIKWKIVVRVAVCPSKGCQLKLVDYVWLVKI